MICIYYAQFLFFVFCCLNLSSTFRQISTITQGQISHKQEVFCCRSRTWCIDAQRKLKLFVYVFSLSRISEQNADQSASLQRKTGRQNDWPLLLGIRHLCSLHPKRMYSRENDPLKIYERVVFNSRNKLLDGKLYELKLVGAEKKHKKVRR